MQTEKYKIKPLLIPRIQSILALIFLILCMIYPKIYSTVGAMGVFLIILILFYGVNLIQAIKNINKVKITDIQHLPNHEGEDIYFIITATNTSLKKVNSIQFFLNNEKTPVQSIEQNEKKNFTLKHIPKKRGHYEMPVFNLKSDWPLSIVFFEYKISSNKGEVYVYPKILNNNVELPFTQQNINTQQDAQHAAFDEQDEFDHLRQYRHGDRLKDIDWKTTARIGTPVSKVMKNYQNQKLHLTWNQVNHLEYETGISQLATWIKNAEQQGYPYSLSLSGAQIPIGIGPKHFQECMRLLTELPEEAL